jgi:iron complex transport system substrate-binding protein
MVSVFPLLLCCLLLFSCQHPERGGTPQGTAFIDDLGSEVHLRHTPQRIISLAPNITEILFALGVEDQLAAVTDYCDFPERAKRKPKVGGLLNPNLERIIELKPDLVIMTTSGNMRGDYERLQRLGISVYVTNPRNVEGIWKSIRDLGALSGANERADSLLQELQSIKLDIERLVLGKQPRTVLFLVSLNPLVVVGPDSFLDELIHLAGGKNIAGNLDTPYPILSREEVLQRRPEVLLATRDAVHSLEAMLNVYPEWRSLPAVTQGRVHLIDPNIVTRPGPRVMQALRLLYEMIHSAPSTK